MDKNFSQYYFFRNKSHANWPGIEPDFEDFFFACERFLEVTNPTNFAYPTHINFMTVYDLYNKLLEATTQRYYIA
jgi:hypothetical protein